MSTMSRRHKLAKGTRPSLLETRSGLQTKLSPRRKDRVRVRVVELLSPEAAPAHRHTWIPALRRICLILRRRHLSRVVRAVGTVTVAEVQARVVARTPLLLVVVVDMPRSVCVRRRVSDFEHLIMTQFP